MKGRFITFEGTEGCGKSTQIKLLSDRLTRHGWKVLQLREPGGTAVGEEIRHLLKHSDSNVRMTAEAELLLINASRAQLVREIIQPALDQGTAVLCDRFFDSTLAYQGFGRELDRSAIEAITQFAIGDLRPDLTLWLDIPLEASEQRRQRRDATSSPQRDRFEEASQSFFQRVENGYRELSELEPDRIHRIDAVGTPEEVTERIWKVVTGRFPKDFSR